MVYFNIFARWWKDPDLRGPKTYKSYGSGTLVEIKTGTPYLRYYGTYIM